MSSVPHLRDPAPAGPATRPESPDWRLFHANADIWPAVLAESEEA